MNVKVIGSAEARQDFVYSSFGHLSRGLFWKPDDLIMVVGDEINVYLDESGSENNSSKFFLVTGLLGIETDWRELDKEWRDALREENQRRAAAGIKERTCYFHAKDYFQKRNDPDDSFIRRLAEIVSHHDLYGFTVVLQPSLWDRVNTKYQLEEARLFPYPICGRGCVVLASEWCAKEKLDFDRVKFFFEDREYNHWNDLGDWLKRRFGFRPVSGYKKKETPLQAADYVAWLIQKHLGLHPENSAEMR